MNYLIEMAMETGRDESSVTKVWTHDATLHATLQKLDRTMWPPVLRCSSRVTFVAHHVQKVELVSTVFATSHATCTSNCIVCRTIRVFVTCLLRTSLLVNDRVDIPYGWLVLVLVEEHVPMLNDVLEPARKRVDDRYASIDLIWWSTI